MSRDRQEQHAPAPAPSEAAESHVPAEDARALDAMVAVGSARDVAEAIRQQPERERDALVARVHRVRGNRFALDVEASLLHDRDVMSPLEEGEFDLSAAESRIVIPSLEGSRAVIEMLREVPPSKLGPILTAFDRDGLLRNFLQELPFAYVEALADGLAHSGKGHGRLLSIMRTYYQDKDRTDRSVTGILERIPYAGKPLAFAVDGLTFGFASEHDAAYRAKREGVITEDEYVDRSNKAGARAGAVAVASMATGGAAGSYVQGLTTEMAAAGFAGRTASTVLTGGAGGAGAGFGTQLGSDMVDGELSGADEYAQSMAMGAGFGVAGAAAGSAVVASLSPAQRARLAKLAKKFPADNELFEQFREIGQRHAVKVKAWRLDRMLGDGAAAWASPDLAMATAGLAPDTTLRVTGQLTDDGLTVMHAEKLPDAEAFGDTLAKAPEPEPVLTDRPNRRDQRMQELSRDPDNGHKIARKSVAEAEVALGLEEAGVLDPPVRRPVPGDGHSGDFVDGAGNDWDVKAPQSRESLVELQREAAHATGREPRAPKGRLRGEFDVDTTIAEVRGELRSGERTIFDTRKMSASDVEALRRAVTDAGLDAVVRWYPP